jgi:hypothetical protein
MSSFNITNFRSELRVHLGNLDSTDLPNTDADLLLNRSKWDLEESLDIKQNEVHTQISTVSGVATIAVAFPVDAVLNIALNDTEQEKWIPLYPISEDEYNAQYSTDVEAQGKPTHWFKRGTNLVFYPTPDEIYSLEVTRKEILTDLSDANTTIAFSQKLQEILLIGAVARGWLRQRDYNSYYRQRDIVKGLLATYVSAEVKEQANWHHAQVQPIINRYEPN